MEERNSINLIVLFDYVYYRFAYLEENIFDRGYVKEYRSKAYLTLFQTFNILSIYRFEKKILVIKDMIYFVLCYILLFSLNHYRYSKVVNYNELADKWDKDSKKQRWLKALIMIGYFIVSFVLIGI
jgi:hypothetical protein